VRAALRSSILLAALLAAGCAGRNGAPTGAATSAPTSSVAAPASGATAASATRSAATSPASTTTPSDWGRRAGCPSVGGGLPPDIHLAHTVDVDGDGRLDKEWIATQPDASGAIAFGARTASGAVFFTTFRSASPVARSVMFADVTGHGEVIALASDGRQVLLYTVSDCRLVPEQNVQGRPYAFDLGFTGYGTGVGCADADGNGSRDLLGLKLVTGSGGTPTAIQRTIIELRGAQARNGARSTATSPSAAEAKLATSITCGALTMAANGVTSEP
jgi:hypothetical protein